MEFAAVDYNLEIKGVAGCMVSRKLINSVKSVHVELWKKMDSVYGIGAKQRFEKNVEKELTQILKSYNIVENKRDIKKLMRKERNENEDSVISLQGKITDNIYYWHIFSLNPEKYPEKLWHSEYIVVVDVKKNGHKIESLE